MHFEITLVMIWIVDQHGKLVRSKLYSWQVVLHYFRLVSKDIYISTLVEITLMSILMTYSKACHRSLFQLFITVWRYIYTAGSQTFRNLCCVCAMDIKEAYYYTFVIVWDLVDHYFIHAPNERYCTWYNPVPRTVASSSPWELYHSVCHALMNHHMHVYFKKRIITCMHAWP